jgi:hypothetical protein
MGMGRAGGPFGRALPLPYVRMGEDTYLPTYF